MSVRMTKDEFASAMEAIEKQHKHDVGWAKSLGVAFPDAEYPNLLYNNEYIRNGLLSLLKLLMSDTNDWIEYYIYEMDFGKKDLKVYDNDGSVIPLNNASDLYDLIANI